MLAAYQMTYLDPENVVTRWHEELPAYIGGGMIVAVMFLAVFIGGANAGDHSQSVIEAPATKGHH